jgi:prophage tail gpP-like protein
MTELYPGDLNSVVVQPGDACQVLIGDDPVITGYVDRFSPSISAHGHSIRITGRGKCQDLVDCSAEWPSFQISNANALSIAQKLAKPYGISVTATADVGPPIVQLNIVHGETAYEVVEHICRYRALLAYDLPDGNLVLAKVGSASHSSGIAQGKNVIAAQALYSMDQRYSEYKVYLQSMDTLSDAGGGGNLLATKTDPAVRRHRRKIWLQRPALVDWIYPSSAQIGKQRDAWADLCN